jgi:hypothetical protein
MLKAHELLGFMSPALASEILTFTHDEEKPTYRAVLQAVAEARHVRRVFLERQSRDQRHAAMAATLAKPSQEVAASTLLRIWLVKKHTAMLVDFLDALGIPNEKGVVEDLPGAVDDSKLAAAVGTLLAKHPPEAVAVYLNAFNEMNTAHWSNLQAMLESDPRLQLGGPA